MAVSKTVWTLDEEIEALRLQSAGFATADIATALKRSKAGVSARLHRLQKRTEMFQA